MARIEIRDCTSEDMEHIALHIREADRTEIRRGTLQPPLLICQMTLNASPQMARVGLADGEPVVAFGCAEMLVTHPDVGRPWLFTTNALAHHQKAFLRRCRNAVEDEMLSRWSLLENWVDVHNDRAIEWLRWLNFRVDPEPVMFGPLLRPFYHFWRTA